MKKESFRFIKIIFLLISFYGGYAANAQRINKKIKKEGKGINFINKISLKELLKKADNDNKIIFIDVYTTWCVPCKHMEKEIFPLKVVGNFFNQNFINYRIDAEKGEGISITKKYKVNAYPTYLFIDKKGNLIFQAEGYDPNPEVFINIGKTALKFSSGSSNLQYYSGQYASNKSNKKFLKKYLILLHKLNKSNDTILDQYTSLLSKEELLKSRNATLIINLVNTSDSKTYKKIIKYQNDFANAVSWGKTPLNQWYNSPKDMLGIILGNVIMNDFIASIRYKDSSLFNNLIYYSTKIKNPGERFKENINIGRIRFYARIKDTSHLIKYAHEYADSLIQISDRKMDSVNNEYFNEKEKEYLMHKMDTAKAIYFINHTSEFKDIFSSRIANILNGIAIHFYELIYNPIELKSALRWSNRAIELDGKRPQLLNTRAQLLFKLNRKEDAINEIKKIIQQLKSTNNHEELELYERELSEIQSKKK